MDASELEKIMLKVELWFIQLQPNEKLAIYKEWKPKLKRKGYCKFSSAVIKRRKDERTIYDVNEKKYFNVKKGTI